MRLYNQRFYHRAIVCWVRGCVGLAAGMSLFVLWHESIGLPSALNSGPPRSGATVPRSHVNVYDADTAHLWNRLHDALFVRTAWDGKSYGHDELDPLLWPNSKFLLAGEQHRLVVSLLDEFLSNDGEILIKDPLKQIVLQHDLWAVFDWLANPNAPYGYRSDNSTWEHRQLQIRLAKVIRRLSLSPEQIQQLPDTYAEAIKARIFSTDHDAEKPERAFLPPDLFDRHGPWVLLEDQGKPAAPVHIRSVNGRSAFFVLMRLPAGRMATLAYLEKLGAFPNAVIENTARVVRLNPALPQFPIGTQVALVREILAIDSNRKLRPTRLIESLQFRVYREIPKGDAAHFDAFDDLKRKQYSYEFRITRKDLFARRAGGLHAVGFNEEGFNLLIPLPHDRFEENPPINPGTSIIMQACSDCHSSSGIHSVEAFRRGFIDLPRPPHLEISDRFRQERDAMLHKWEKYSWGLLQGLMEKE